MTKRRGVAMIVVLIMVLVMTALILIVVAAAGSAIRFASKSRTRAVAMQVAEAGIQEGLYWMNYRGYLNDHYPCTYDNLLTPRLVNYDASYKYLDPSIPPDPLNPASTIRWVPGPVSFNPTGIKDASCIVEFEDSLLSNHDRMTSTGNYRGSQVRISVNIRGENGEGNTGNQHNTKGRLLRGDVGFDLPSQSWTAVLSTWGVPESFNKHAIYANRVQAAGPGTAQLYGNVARLSTSDTIVSGGTTWTHTTILPGMYDGVMPDTGAYQIPLNPGAHYQFQGGQVTEVSTGWIRPLPIPGVTYDVVQDEYTFADTDIDYSIRVIGNMIIGGTTTRLSGYVQVDLSLYMNASFYATDIGRTQNAVFEPGTILAVAAGITITGDLVVKGLAVGLPAGGVTIDGAFVTDSNFAMPGATRINATQSQRRAAILIVNNTANVIGSIGSGTPTITLGPNQNAVAMMYSRGANTLELRLNGVNFNTNPLTGLGQKAIVVGYSSGGPVSVSIGNSTSSTIPGLIYARGGASNGSVTVRNNSRVPGIIVANGLVNVDAGTVAYNPTVFKDLQYGAVYRGFFGGRRVYLPVPGSWRIQ